VIRGGLRSRLVTDSLRITVLAGLQTLGWFDPTISDTPPGPRRHRPVRYVARPVNWNEPIEPNCFAVSSEIMEEEEHGLGGEVEDKLHLYIDLYAENDQIGWHLARDIRDLLLGRLPGTGRAGPVIDVYDLRMATPAPFTQVDIDEITIDRVHSEALQYQNHWFVIGVDLLDEYLDEWDGVHVASAWTDRFSPLWAQIQAVEMA
jgi:hypothetical protein